MNKPVTIFLLSLLKTAAVAAIFATIAFFTGQSPVLWFLITFVAQYIVFYIVGYVMEYISARQMRLVRLKEAEIVALNTIKVDCASCKKESSVIIRTDRVNRFVCGFCKAKNAIYISTETALVTDPLYENDPKTPGISND